MKSSFSGMFYTKIKVEMKVGNYVMILLLFLFSCSDSRLIHELESEYKRLAERTNRQIVINKINLLGSKSIDFEELANTEVQIYKGINELRKEELQMIDELDSLLEIKIDQQKCWLRNANSENQVQYLQEIKSDSIQLKENIKERLLLKIGKMEDEVKILKIYELSALDSIEFSKNSTVWHTIDISIDDKRIVDTLLYVSFNNRNYNYLNKNLFLEN